MKKGICIFMGLFLPILINNSYSQFYDVKQKKRIAVVNLVTENKDNPVFSKNEVVPTPMQTPENKPVEESPKGSDKLPSPHLLSAPLDTLVVTSGYGYRIDPFSGKRKFHYGTDYRTCAQNVYAMMPGRVRKIGYNKVLGNYIELDHGDFNVTYAHLHTVIGEKGDNVNAGQSVGISGNTGRSHGEHLHVAIRYKNKSVDPDPLVRYISEWSRRVKETLLPDENPTTESAVTTATEAAD